MAVRWKVGLSDFWSAIRHASFPPGAFIVEEVIKALSGKPMDLFNPAALKIIIPASVGAGLLRYGQRWLSNIPEK